MKTINLYNQQQESSPNLSQVTKALLGPAAGALFLILSSCAPEEGTKALPATTTTPPPAQTEVLPSSYLYVATGTCYSGGVTTFSSTTASNLVYRINTSTGVKDLTIADYNAFPAAVGDSPVGIVSVDSTTLKILIENTAGRRIENVPKTSNPARSLFSGSTTILSTVLKNMKIMADGSLLIVKSSGIEKVTASGVRIGAPFVTSNLGATCGTANTSMTSVNTLGNSKIVFTHAAAGKNQFAIISASGYSSAADCLAVQAAPVATAYPTASHYIQESKQLIVAYAGTSAVSPDINSIYVYDIDETTNAISGATKLYDASLYPATHDYLLFGISSITYDSVTKSLYVATAISNATTAQNYAIEKFTYDPTAKTITRTTPSTAFYDYASDTKCISSMKVAD